MQTAPTLRLRASLAQTIAKTAHLVEEKDVAADGGQGSEGSEQTRTLSLLGLPPLQLRARLPSAYPSRAPPVFALRCAWLSDEQLRAIASAMDAQVRCRHTEGEAGGEGRERPNL
eukprot:1547265-Pleurochrysis_carterae.AAC.1